MALNLQETSATADPTHCINDGDEEDEEEAEDMETFEQSGMLEQIDRVCLCVMCFVLSFSTMFLNYVLDLNSN